MIKSIVWLLFFPLFQMINLQWIFSQRITDQTKFKTWEHSGLKFIKNYWPHLPSLLKSTLPIKISPWEKEKQLLKKSVKLAAHHICQGLFLIESRPIACEHWKVNLTLNSLLISQKERYKQSYLYAYLSLHDSVGYWVNSTRNNDISDGFT